jgi:hypothetical protein
LETPQGRCLTILAYGVNLRPEPKDGTWTWRKAVFPDSLIQLLLAGGLVSIEGDGASSVFLAITKRGLEAYNKLSGEQVQAEGDTPNIPAAPKPGRAAGAPPAPLPAMSFEEREDEELVGGFDDLPDLPPEESPFRFS